MTTTLTLTKMQQKMPYVLADFRRDFWWAAKTSGAQRHWREDIFDPAADTDDIVWIWRHLIPIEAIYQRLPDEAFDFLHNAGWHSQWLNIGDGQRLRIYKYSVGN